MSIVLGFDWNGANFLHSSWYGVKIWICAASSVHHIGMVWLLLSSVYTESRTSLFLVPFHQRAGWGYTRRWEGTQPEQLAQLAQGVCHHTQHINLVGKKGGRGTFEVKAFCLPKPPLPMMEPYFLGYH